MSFAYQAQTLAGQPITGTIDAPDGEHARQYLSSLGLRVTQVQEVENVDRPTPIRGEDFVAFNQQLAQLTAAGLPIERGLRLIAQEMASGRLKASVQQIAAELESGTPLGESFEKHRGQFPPLYGRLIDAGVKANNLPGMLFNLGRHHELVRRMRSSLWQSLSYPLIVLFGLMIVLSVIGLMVIPQYRSILDDFDTELPWITKFVFVLADYSFILLGVSIFLVIAIPILIFILRLTGSDVAAGDGFGFPLPLIGKVMKYNLLARWCDSAKLAIDAGLDLPQAIDLASRAMGSPTFEQDGETMVGILEQGRSLDSMSHWQVVPPSVRASMELAQGQEQLSEALAGLAALYEQQAERRLEIFRTLLPPIILILLAAVMMFVIAGIFLPMINLLTSLTG